MSDSLQFYSNGKLLITGEYLVLDGAVALALPTKFGQSLTIKKGIKKGISWTGFDFDQQIWLKTHLDYQQIIHNQKTADEKVNRLINVLHQAHLMDENIMHEQMAFDIETHLTFPRLWGLGTSSTFINNVAQWFKIDAFELLKNTFGGSGYDLACAKNNTPILYRLIGHLPEVKTVDFNPTFKNYLYFVYLNQKQDSQLAVKAYFNKRAKVEKEIRKVSKITKNILETSDFKTFCQLIEKHEIITSDVLEQSSIKESLFPDFQGQIKSLGAWGGDFIMVASEENPTDYFKSKGFNVVLTWEEMVF
jgi:mevalonate kinase